MNSTAGGTRSAILEDKAAPWKVLIADEEPDVHVATKLALRDFSFNNRGIEFLDAYDGIGTCEILRQHPDTAVIFLDVVMEAEDSGLKAIRCIRDQLGNRLVRIILRTGQPEQAPEQQVTLDYPINGYTLKSELTARKLFTSLVVALRSYQELHEMDSKLRALQR